MSCTLSHELSRVILAELLSSSKDATRGWLRAAMDRLVDPMLDSIFNRLQTKLTNGLERTQSGDGDGGQVNPNPNLQDQSVNLIPKLSTSSFNPTSTHFNPQFVNLNNSFQQQNGKNHLDSISNQQLSIQSQLVSIKEEIETNTIEQTSVDQDQSFWYEQSSQNLTDQNWNNHDECANSRMSNLQNIEMHSRQFIHIKTDNQFDDEECDDGGIEVEEKDEDDVEDHDEESSRPAKKTRIDSNQPKNDQTEVVRQLLKQQIDESQSDKDKQDEEGEQSEDIDTRATIELNDQFQYNSDESMVIQQEERNASNQTGGKSIENECTTKTIQPNLAQLKRHLQCPHCRKSFYCNSNLQRHVRVHTGERPFHCDQCDRRFSDRSNLTQHQLIHQNIKRFQCHECNKQFSDRSNLTQHQLIHQNIKRFQCHECNKQFTFKHVLDSHLRIHSGERPFECQHCDKSFNTKSNLTKHQMIHQNIKQFRCHECEMQFTHKHHLLAHLLTHSGGRPFECRHCEKSFADLSTRNRHEQAIHLHVKPYRCKQCGHTATRRSDVIRHIRVIHFGLPKTTKQQQALNIINDRDPRELVEKV